MSFLLLDPALRAARREVDEQTDRAAAIIACAILDDVLTRALQKRLILAGNVKDYLFSHDKNGPVSTLANKINIGFAVGIINKDVHTDLHNVRRIRNHFAHKLEQHRFKDPEVAQWCTSLHAPSQIKDPRKRFLYVTFGASTALMLVAKLDIKLLDLTKQPGLGAEIRAEMDVLTEQLTKFATRASSPDKSG